jgi:putative transposase
MGPAGAVMGQTKFSAGDKLMNQIESQFRTMKYRPEFSDRFGCIQDSRAFSQGFFRWCNEEYRLSSLGLLTPAMVHYNQTAVILEQRQTVLDAAYRLHPERFVRQAPKLTAVPTEVWINKPLNTNEKLTKFHDHWSQTR